MNKTGKNKDDDPMVEKPSYEELEKRIQELEKTESEHKLAEDRLKKIFNNTQDAIYTADIISHQGVLDKGVAFIQKPFLMGDLIEKLREVLDTYSPVLLDINSQVLQEKRQVI
ncbi:MAG: hypothetical protein U9P10_12955 [Thermodesulfobacteriota bacterium]|nr:hypothetical protein [Thermodesulfobacteriota bacterium]